MTLKNEQRPNSHAKVACLRAAAELVKKKKVEANERGDSEAAAQMEKKLADIGAQLVEVQKTCEAEDLHALSEQRAATENKLKALRSRSIFTMSNPFHTVDALRDSGYSRCQACGLLLLLYVVVLGFELLVLYAIWLWWNYAPSDSGIDDGFDEF